MKLSVKGTNLVLSHLNKNINWSKVYHQKKQQHKPNDIYSEINKYWDTLPENDLNNIFSLYSEIDVCMMHNRSTKETVDDLKPLVAELMAYHQYDDMLKFMETVKIVYPDTVPVKYDNDNVNISRDTTYIQSEYFKLLVVACMLRPMIPIWLIFTSTKGTDNEIFKELDCLKMLYNTDIIDLPPVQRLLRLIDGVKHKALPSGVKGKTALLTTIIKGIGTEELNIWLLADIFCITFSRTPITIKAISAGNRDIALIKSIFKRIKDNVTKLGSRFKISINESVLTVKGDDEDKIGYFENFQNRQKVSDDVYIATEVSLADYRATQRALSINVLTSTCMHCVSSFKRYYKEPIRLDQIQIIQLVLGGYKPNPKRDRPVDVNSVIHPRTVEHIGRQSILQALGLTTAILIEKGLLSLAKLMSSAVTLCDSDDTTASHNHIDNIPTELKERLLVHYPYMPQHGNYKTRQVNVAINAVDDFCKLLADYEIQYVGSDKVKSLLGINDIDHPLGSNIKTELAELIISINRNKELITSEYRDLIANKTKE